VIVLTDHAVEQYVSRFDRTLSFARARQLLTEQLPHAVKLQELSLKKDTMCRLPGGAVLVTKPDKYGKHVVVTILKKRSGSVAVPTDDELQEMLAETEVPVFEGQCVIRVEVVYSRTTLGHETVRARIANSIEALMSTLQESGIAKASIESFKVTEEFPS